jgi:hypothetical protein
VLVEWKRSIKDLKAAAGQVRSYALWVLPASYVITDTQTVTSLSGFRRCHQAVPTITDAALRPRRPSTRSPLY